MWRLALRLRALPFRAGAGILLLATLLLAFCLCVSPHFHERLHSGANSTAHECVVTILVSGNCEPSAGGYVVVGKPFLISSGLFTQQLPVVIATTEMSILEHAPPFILLNS